MYNRCSHLYEGATPLFASESITTTTTLTTCTPSLSCCRGSGDSSSNNGDGGGDGISRGSNSRNGGCTSGGGLLLSGAAIVKLSTYFLISLIFLIPTRSLAAGPPYETAYACEGKTLTISCDPGDLINLIRANYGRFSITICNDHGNVEWSVNCMSPKSLHVLHSKCTNKQNCSVLASTNMFGDPCPGTHKYLEAHYQCTSAAQSSTTTTRPSPPWLITNSPNVWSTSTIPATVTSAAGAAGHPPPSPPTTARIGSIHQMVLPQKPPPQPPPQLAPAQSPAVPKAAEMPAAIAPHPQTPTNIHLAGGRPPIVEPFGAGASGGVGVGGLQSSKTTGNTTHTVADGGAMITNRTAEEVSSGDSQSAAEGHDHTTQTTSSVLVNNQNSLNSYEGGSDANGGYYCGPTTMRNLFWNITRVGEVNVQPCPGGAFGIAKWRCVLHQIATPLANQSSNAPTGDSSSSDSASSSSSSGLHRTAAWHPMTPDLTQCRSVWINNLEISVNQRDSSLISIANDLSQITSSKTLYGGDMLVTTKIIQTMSEKMAYDIETFPDQKQREAIISELLSGVVKTGSNLLDISHKHTWLDLSFEDQMRVATSLLTGLEDNAFLLADSIIRERAVVQKVKNILLSIRVLETRNIVGNEVFPDGKMEQWDVSEDRIELPRGALIENSEAGLVRIVFVAFDRLETILKPWLNHLDVKFTKNEMQQRNQSRIASPVSGGQSSAAGSQAGLVQNRILNSKVISASLGKGRHIQLSQPIRLVLRHLKVENVSNPVCVFWNYIDHAWSEDGCYLEHTNHTHTVCMCNHLTNFAILMDTADEPAPSLLSLFNNNIRILIYISIAICIIFIIVAILTLKLFSGIFVKVRQRRRGRRRRRSSDSIASNSDRDHQQQHQQPQNNRPGNINNNSSSSSSNLNHLHHNNNHNNHHHHSASPAHTVNNITNNSRNLRNISNLSSNNNNATTNNPNDSINNSLVVEMVSAAAASGLIAGRFTAGSGRGLRNHASGGGGGGINLHPYQQQQQQNAAAGVALAAEFQQRLLALPNFASAMTRAANVGSGGGGGVGGSVVGQQHAPNNHHTAAALLHAHHTHHPHSNNHSMIVNNSLVPNSNLINYKNTNACNALLFATSSLMENSVSASAGSGDVNTVVAPLNIVGANNSKPNVLYD